ncbi:MAG: hypothetical protein ACR2H3_02295, partial [Acidimicrobiales bacterium]
MKFLLDTNAFIAVEPVTDLDVEAGSAPTARLLRLLAEGSHEVFVHPAARMDIARDLDAARKRARQVQFDKYRQLTSPPQVPADWAAVLGSAATGTNDDVDHRHLAAVGADAVHYLVTEDQGLHRMARRVGLGERVLTVAGALAVLEALFGVDYVAPPAVDPILAYELDLADPIFDSLREDYSGFDAWLQRARLEHRRGWVIRDHADGYAGLCLVKPEEDGNDAGLLGKVLKISTFKVSERHSGLRYGELLLKTIFGYADANDYVGLYLTTFAQRQPGLLRLVDDFGFTDEGRHGEEVILAKRLHPTAEEMERLSPLELHIRFGPPLVKVVDGQTFVVPVEPRFARRLFPELPGQLELTATPTPYGNAIKKAYLCHAAIRAIEPGATLLIYRSQDERSVGVVGVVDDLVVSRDPALIASAVGTRTVYTMPEIETMSQRGEILALLFRQASLLADPVPLKVLVGAGL